MTITDAAEALVNLERIVAVVKGDEARESKFAKALATLESLSRKEGISIAIVGGLAAIRHGYQRFTKDIDVVVQRGHLDILARVAPQYGIKVIWKDPDGWHKMQCEGVPIDVVPEGRKPRKGRTYFDPKPRASGRSRRRWLCGHRRLDGNQAWVVWCAGPSRRRAGHQGNRSRNSQEDTQAPG